MVQGQSGFMSMKRRSAHSRCFYAKTLCSLMVPKVYISYNSLVMCLYDSPDSPHRGAEFGLWQLKANNIIKPGQSCYRVRTSQWQDQIQTRRKASLKKRSKALSLPSLPKMPVSTPFEDCSVSLLTRLQSRSSWHRSLSRKIGRAHV